MIIDSTNERDRLVQEILETQPELRRFLRSENRFDLLSSWDMLAFSFERGFETLWGHAKQDVSGLLLHPLLLLWRHSVELTIKAAICDVAGKLIPPTNHNLEELFDELLRQRKERGFDDDNDHARNVRTMIALVQAIDPGADRFRYPSSRKGQWFASLSVDLDELYQAHWIINAWCQGAALEVQEALAEG